MAELAKVEPAVQDAKMGKPPVHPYTPYVHLYTLYTPIYTFHIPCIHPYTLKYTLCTSLYTLYSYTQGL